MLVIKLYFMLLFLTTYVFGMTPYSFPLLILLFRFVFILIRARHWVAEGYKIPAYVRHRLYTRSKIKYMRGRVITVNSSGYNILVTLTILCQTSNVTDSHIYINPDLFGRLGLCLGLQVH